MDTTETRADRLLAGRKPASRRVLKLEAANDNTESWERIGTVVERVIERARAEALTSCDRLRDGRATVGEKAAGEPREGNDSAGLRQRGRSPTADLQLTRPTRADPRGDEARAGRGAIGSTALGIPEPNENPRSARRSHWPAASADEGGIGPADALRPPEPNGERFPRVSRA